MTYTASDFQIGDIVRPVGAGNISYFKQYLAGNIPYVVVAANSQSQLITVQYDDGIRTYRDRVYAHRVAPTSDPNYKYFNVITKIKQMEQKRKELGYRW